MCARFSFYHFFQRGMASNLGKKLNVKIGLQLHSLQTDEILYIWKVLKARSKRTRPR